MPEGAAGLGKRTAIRLDQSRNRGDQTNKLAQSVHTILKLHLFLVTSKRDHPNANADAT